MPASPAFFGERQERDEIQRQRSEAVRSIGAACDLDRLLVSVCLCNCGTAVIALAMCKSKLTL